MNDNPSATGSPFANLLTGISSWLGKQIDQLMPYPPKTLKVAPPSMTDEQLHNAIYRDGAKLLNNISVHVLMPTYANNGVEPDPRFPHGMPTTVRDHVLTMFTSAHDSFGLSVIGLGKHATAAAGRSSKRSSVATVRPTSSSSETPRPPGRRTRCTTPTSTSSCAG